MATRDENLLAERMILDRAGNDQAADAQGDDRERLVLGEFCARASMSRAANPRTTASKLAFTGSPARSGRQGRQRAPLFRVRHVPNGEVALDERFEPRVARHSLELFLTHANHVGRGRLE